MIDRRPGSVSSGDCPRPSAIVAGFFALVADLSRSFNSLPSRSRGRRAPPPPRTAAAAHRRHGSLPLPSLPRTADTAGAVAAGAVAAKAA
eukprot:3133109-Prymnesium_polylepis.1